MIHDNMFMVRDLNQPTLCGRRMFISFYIVDFIVETTCAKSSFVCVNQITRSDHEANGMCLKSASTLAREAQVMTFGRATSSTDLVLRMEFVARHRLFDVSSFT